MPKRKFKVFQDNSKLTFDCVGTVETTVGNTLKEHLLEACRQTEALYKKACVSCRNSDPDKGVYFIPEGWNEHYQESTLLFQDSKTKQVYVVVNWNSSFQKWSNDPIETWNNIRLDLFESRNWCTKPVS